MTVAQTSPSATPKDFTTELFNYWEIGKAESDNGILFLVSTSDRRVEIETGYGIEPILPDAKVGNIIDTKITPRFKQKVKSPLAIAIVKAIALVALIIVAVAKIIVVRSYSRRHCCGGFCFSFPILC